MAAVTECGSLLKNIIMNIESKEFWEKVKNEYLECSDYFICNNSRTFTIEWYGQNRSLIFGIAEIFLKEVKDVNFRPFVTALFIPNNRETYTEFSINQKIRIKFLDYCIQKYSK